VVIQFRIAFMSPPCGGVPEGAICWMGKPSLRDAFPGAADVKVVQMALLMTPTFAPVPEPQAIGM
jgi:hypothetical protein